MSGNGRIGRAKILSRIKRELLAEAVFAGIDVNNRAAVQAWKNQRSKETYERLKTELQKRTSP